MRGSWLLLRKYVRYFSARSAPTSGVWVKSDPRTWSTTEIQLFKAMTLRVTLIGCWQTHLHASTCQGHGGVNALGQQLTKWRAGEPLLAVRIACVRPIFCTIPHHPSFEVFMRRYVLWNYVWRFFRFPADPLMAFHSNWLMLSPLDSVAIVNAKKYGTGSSLWTLALCTATI